MYPYKTLVQKTEAFSLRKIKSELKRKEIEILPFGSFETFAEERIKHRGCSVLFRNYDLLIDIEKRKRCIKHIYMNRKREPAPQQADATRMSCGFP